MAAVRVLLISARTPSNMSRSCDVKFRTKLSTGVSNVCRGFLTTPYARTLNNQEDCILFEYKRFITIQIKQSNTITFNDQRPANSHPILRLQKFSTTRDSNFPSSQYCNVPKLSYYCKITRSLSLFGSVNSLRILVTNCEISRLFLFVTKFML